MNNEDPLPFNWIVADNSKLPPNIRSLTAEKMDADTLRRAMALMTFPVNVVEIRVPINDDYKRRFKEFLAQYRREEDILPQIYGVTKTPRDVLDDLTNYFETTVNSFCGSEQEQQTLEETRDLVLGMHSAFSEIWENAASGFRFWAAGNTDISDDNMVGFHTHRAEDINDQGWPGFYLNFTASDIGTMFTDRAGGVWVGEGWSYFLFPTAGHPLESRLIEAEHSYPTYQYGFEEQKRGTFISQMFLPPTR
jgi:hypothetical protein